VKKIIERLLLKKKSKNLVLVLFVDWMEADVYEYVLQSKKGQSFICRRWLEKSGKISREKSHSLEDWLFYL